MQPTDPPTRYRRIALIALALLTLAVYGRNVTFDFINWDDLDLVVQNKMLNPVTPSGLLSVWTQPRVQVWTGKYGAPNLYTPVAYTLWAAAALLGRSSTPDQYGVTLNPMVFHLLNVLLHAGCVLLVFDVLSRLLPLPRRETRAMEEASDDARAVVGDDRLPPNASRSLTDVEQFSPPLTFPIKEDGLKPFFPAFIGAAVFAVHPLQAEAVSWISGMNNVLAGLLSVAAMSAYLRSMTSARSRSWYIASIVLLVLGLLSKPTAIVTPAMLLVIDYFIVGRQWRVVLGKVWPLFAVTLPFVILGRMIEPGADIYTPTLAQRVLVMLDTIGFYFSKLAWPHPLLFDYGRIPQIVIEHGVAITSWVALAIVGAIVITSLLKKRPKRVGAVGVFIVGILPVSGITPFSYQVYSTVADRYAYLAMLGAAILVALALNATLARRSVRVVAGAVVFVLLVLTFVQSGYWQDSYTVANHALAYNERSFAAHDTLGFVYRRDKQFDQAALHLQQAVAIKPDDPLANMNLGSLLLQLNRPAEAVLYLKRAKDWGYEEPKLLYQLGSAYMQSGRLSEASATFQQVLQRDPNQAAAYSALGYTTAAMGKLDEAEGYLRKALQLDPSYTPAKMGLERVLAAKAAPKP